MRAAVRVGLPLVQLTDAKRGRKNNMAFECKFCSKPTKNGTGKAAHERGCVENPNHLPTKTELKREARAAVTTHRCPECEATGQGQGFDNEGLLHHHRVRMHGAEPLNQSRKPVTHVAVVNNHVALNGNGHSPAQMKRSLRHQARNRDDLVAIVRVVFPDGIETRDPHDLDSSLSYVFQTASMLERRP